MISGDILPISISGNRLPISLPPLRPAGKPIDPRKLYRAGGGHVTRNQDVWLARGVAAYSGSPGGAVDNSP